MRKDLDLSQALIKGECLGFAELRFRVWLKPRYRVGFNLGYELTLSLSKFRFSEGTESTFGLGSGKFWSRVGVRI